MPNSDLFNMELERKSDDIKQCEEWPGILQSLTGLLQSNTQKCLLSQNLKNSLYVDNDVEINSIKLD